MAGYIWSINNVVWNNVSEHRHRRLVRAAASAYRDLRRPPCSPERNRHATAARHQTRLPGHSGHARRVGRETGTWASLHHWKKGYVAPPHKHLAGAHAFIISGKLQVRNGILNAGDYVYEPSGILHDATTALEDTTYLFICNGAVLFFDENGFTRYTNWEVMEKLRSQGATAEVQAQAAE